MMANPKSMMTGESYEMTLHTVLRLDDMEYYHHSTGDCLSFLLVDSYDRQLLLPLDEEYRHLVGVRLCLHFEYTR